VVLSAADPLNLTGVITAGERVATRYSDRILYREGVPIAVHDGEQLRWLEKPRQDLDLIARPNCLRSVCAASAERLRAFYGKGDRLNHPFLAFCNTFWSRGVIGSFLHLIPTSAMRTTALLFAFVVAVAATAPGQEPHQGRR
jgi:hypothetical protein